MLVIKNKILSKKEVYCTSFLSKMLGLMFSSKKILVFVFKSNRLISLHNWFVFFEINLYFLDSDRRIVEIKKKFKPFTFYKCRKPAMYVIESPEILPVKLKECIDFK